MWKEPELSPRLGSPDEEFLETTAERVGDIHTARSWGQPPTTANGARPLSQCLAELNASKKDMGEA
ncbi:mCG1028441, isoform CRA_b [Mus musculus]|nr:mCG1028441, isoform CRA_b [Mus musculus]